VLLDRACADLDFGVIDFISTKLTGKLQSCPSAPRLLSNPASPAAGQQQTGSEKRYPSPAAILEKQI